MSLLAYIYTILSNNFFVKFVAEDNFRLIGCFVTVIYAQEDQVYATWLFWLLILCMD